MTLRVQVVLSCAMAMSLGAAAPAAAQGRQAVAAAVLEFTAAVQGRHGDEGPQLSAALDAMARALSEWDRELQQIEHQMLPALDHLPRAEAARLLVTLSRVLIQRGRDAEALERLDRAAVIDPRDADSQLLRGFLFRTRRPADALPAFRRAWELDRGDPVKAYWLTLALHEKEDAERPADVLATLAAAYRLLAERDPNVNTRPFFDPALLRDSASEIPIFPLVAYEEGYALLTRREYNRALAVLREAAATDRLVTDPALRSDAAERGIAALKAGQPADAVDAFEEAAAQAPDSSDIHRLLGMALRAAGRFEDSVARLQTAIALDPRNERARIELVSVLEPLGSGTRARRAVEDALTILPSSGALRWMSAVLHRRLDQEEAMLEQLEAIPAAAILSGRAQVLSAIGRLHLAGSRYPDALPPFRSAVLASPNNPLVHLDIAELYRTEGHAAPALASFVASLLIAPGAVDAHVGVGQIYLTQARLEDAAVAFERALTLAPEHADALYGLGRALLRLGKPEQAAPHLDAFHRLTADREAALRANYELFGLKREAAVLTDEDRHDEAVAAWQAIVQREPRNADNHRELGEAIVASGDVDLGIAVLERSAALQPSTSIYRRLAELYTSTGQTFNAARVRGEYERLQAESLRRQADQ